MKVLKPDGTFLAVTTRDFLLFDIHTTHTQTHTHNGAKNKMKAHLLSSIVE